MDKILKQNNIWILHHYATLPVMNGLTRPYDFGIYLKEYGYNTKVFASSHLHYMNSNVINDNSLYIVNNESEIPFVFIKTNSSSKNGIRRFIGMLIYYLNVLKVSKEFIKTGEKPDFIIASSPHPLAMLAGIKIAKKLNIPSICEIRDFWPEVFFKIGLLKETSIIGRLLIYGEHAIYRKANALIFLKEGDYTYITDRKWDKDQGGDIDISKCHYINNGVNNESFANQAINERYEDRDLDGGKFNIVYTGAIRTINNVGNLLDAAKILKNNKHIQILIYGDGDQTEALRQRISDEMITNVKMKGYVEKRYIPYILSKSSLNILNYSQERYNWTRGNSSNKLFEYMASGKPIVSTVKMGFSPIEKYDCGIMLDADTPEALARAINYIYCLTPQRYNELCKNAKTGALDFDYKILTAKLVSIIEKLP